jgi:hypothetical protein
MKTTLERELERRDLVQESAAIRAELARTWGQWTARADSVRRFAAPLRNPLLTGAVSAGAKALPWVRILQIGGAAWTGWRLARDLKKFFR